MLSDNLVLCTVGTYISDTDIFKSVSQFFDNRGFSKSHMLPYAWSLTKEEMKDIKVKDLINVLDNEKGLTFVWEYNGDFITLMQKQM